MGQRVRGRSEGDAARRGVVARLELAREEVWEPACERGPAEISVIFESRCAFSRSIMRQRFSSILQKPVYTFNFDRFTVASPERP